MDSAVMHRIYDPEGWAEALASDHTYPPDFHLHSFVEAQDRHVALTGAGVDLVGRLGSAVERCRGCRWESTAPAMIVQ